METTSRGEATSNEKTRAFAERKTTNNARRQTIVLHLNRMGVTNADERVVVASAFAEGFTAIEGEQSYYNGILGGSFGGGTGRRFGGTGGFYR